jgi:N-alpha-acetyltransferase 15/16, NatA auxiliary subunit
VNALEIDSKLVSPIKDVIDTNADILSPTTPLQKLNDGFLSKHSDKPSHRRSGLKTRQLLDASSLANNEKDLLAILGLESADLNEAIEGLHVLDEWKSDQSVKDKYVAAAAKKWPEATAFAKP